MKNMCLTKNTMFLSQKGKCFCSNLSQKTNKTKTCSLKLLRSCKLKHPVWPWNILLMLREAIPRQLCNFFKHCLNGPWPLHLQFSHDQAPASALAFFQKQPVNVKFQNNCCTWVIKLALIQPLEKDVPTTWDMEWVTFLRKSRSSACSLLDYRLGIGNLSPLNCWKNWPVWQASVSTICAGGLMTPGQRTFLLNCFPWKGSSLQVEILFVYLSVCPPVHHHFFFSFSFRL